MRKSNDKRMTSSNDEGRTQHSDFVLPSSSSRFVLLATCPTTKLNSSSRSMRGNCWPPRWNGLRDQPHLSWHVRASVENLLRWPASSGRRSSPAEMRLLPALGRRPPAAARRRKLRRPMSHAMVSPTRSSRCFARALSIRPRANRIESSTFSTAGAGQQIEGWNT